LFIGTPKGQNHFKELRDRAETEEDWALLEFKASETNILPETELAAARKEMGDDKYFQEFECSFSAAVEGSYYGTILNELAEERFKEIPRDDLCKTFAAWDLGMGDSTAIWVVQVAGQEVRVMDYIENHGQGLDWYVQRANPQRLAQGHTVTAPRCTGTRTNHRQKPIRSLKRGWLRLYCNTKVKRRRWHPGGETTPA
jgi:hypothetical protein